jgi:hypothetical protein
MASLLPPPKPTPRKATISRIQVANVEGNLEHRELVGREVWPSAAWLDSHTLVPRLVEHTLHDDGVALLPFSGAIPGTSTTRGLGRISGGALVKREVNGTERLRF